MERRICRGKNFGSGKKKMSILIRILLSARMKITNIRIMTMSIPRIRILIMVRVRGQECPRHTQIPIRVSILMGAG